MRHRRRRRAAELTPLLDVLFILLFATLVQTRHAAEGGAPAGMSDAGVDAASAADAGIVDAGPAAGAADADRGDAGASDAGGHETRAHRRAALIAGSVRYRDVLVVEVSAAGDVVGRARWRDGVLLSKERLHHRLLREVPPEESDMGIEYRGDSRPEHRLCQIALASIDLATPDLATPDLAAPDLATPDLDRALVVIVADTPLGELPLALRDGLLRDAGRCFDNAGGVAILIDAADEVPIDDSSIDNSIEEAAGGVWNGPSEWVEDDKEWNP